MGLVSRVVVSNMVVIHRIERDRLAFTNLKPLWPGFYIRIWAKNECTPVPFYGWGTRSLRALDVWRISVFEHHYLRNIIKVWWENLISISEVTHKGHGVQSMEPAVNVNRLRLLGHVLRVPTKRLPDLLDAFVRGKQLVEDRSRWSVGRTGKRYEERNQWSGSCRSSQIVALVYVRPLRAIVGGNSW